MLTNTTTDNVFGAYEFSYGMGTGKIDETTLHSLFNPVDLKYTVSSVKELPFIDKIIFNNPATIVFWSDGTKTVVKCMKNQEFNAYYGVACAIMKKYFGNNSSAKAFIDKFREEEDSFETIKVAGDWIDVELGTTIR